MEPEEERLEGTNIALLAGTELEGLLVGTDLLVGADLLAGAELGGLLARLGALSADPELVEVLPVVAERPVMPLAVDVGLLAGREGTVVEDAVRDLEADTFEASAAEADVMPVLVVAD